MSATFTWTVQWMNAYPQAQGETDVVFQVGWQCSGVQVDGDTTYYGSQGGNTLVTYSGGSPFTPYDQLTQEQVLGWVWDSMYPPKDQIEAQVQQQIDAKINPPVVQPPLPWATPAA